MTPAAVKVIRAALRILSRHSDADLLLAEDVALLRSCAIDQAEVNLPIDELACLVVERARKESSGKKNLTKSEVAEAGNPAFRSEAG